MLKMMAKLEMEVAMKNKYISSLLLTVTLLGATVPYSVAFANEIDSPPVETRLSRTPVQSIRFNFSSPYHQKLNQVLDKYSFVEDENGMMKLTFSLTKEELVNQYNFTSEEAERLLREVYYAPELLKEDPGYNGERLHFSKGIIYFNRGDVEQTLNWAASLGPAAMYGVLVGISSGLGPAGTLASSVLGVIGLPSLASFCYVVLQAVANKQGVYLGLTFNGGFPNIQFGYWKG